MNRIKFLLLVILFFTIILYFLISCPEGNTNNGGNGEPTAEPLPSPSPTPVSELLGLVNFETAQQALIIFTNYEPPYIPPADYTIFDAAGPMDDQCQLIWSYDTTNVKDGSTALKTEGMLIENRNGDASRATCQFMINLIGTPLGTNPLVGDGSSLSMPDTTVTAHVYIPTGSPINACLIILMNSGGGETALTHYADVTEGWNLVSYGFNQLGQVIAINEEPVGPLDHDPAFNIGDVVRIEFRLGGPVSASGVPGSANCTIDNINW